MAINFDEIWTNVKKNALGAKDLASLKLKLTKEKAHLDASPLIAPTFATPSAPARSTSCTVRSEKMSTQYVQSRR